MMTKVLRSLWIVAFTFSAVSTAYPWGSATHAHIADLLGSQPGSKHRSEIFGSMAPDAFNYMLTGPPSSELYNLLHYPPSSLELWTVAREGKEKAVAYGFVTHNGAWGADYTAHFAGRTYGTNEGYVVAKGRELMTSHPLPPSLGVPPDMTETLGHGFVETAVDILIKQQIDPLIGKKVVSACGSSAAFSRLLQRTYGDDFRTLWGSDVWAHIGVTLQENQFRKTTVAYGKTLTKDDAQTLQLLAGQMADLAQLYASLNGLTLPPRDQVVALVVEYLQYAMTLCEPDYQQEIEATVEFVREQLTAHGITY
jgi:hypothetical protein